MMALRIILCRYCNYNNSIRIIDQENQGAEIAKNSGVEKAIGDYLVFLDSDDVLFPSALSLYYQIIETENQPALVFAKGTGFNVKKGAPCFSFKKNICSYSTYKDFFSKREPVWLSTSFLVLKHSLWNNSTKFKKGTFPADDLDFLLRIGTLGPCVIIKEPATVAYRYHDNNSIKDTLRIIDKLNYLIEMEKNCEYGGGLKRKVDRLALLGGHIIIWSFRGFKKRYYKKSLCFLLKGLPAVIAKIVIKLGNNMLQRYNGSKCENAKIVY